MRRLIPALAVAATLATTPVLAGEKPKTLVGMGAISCDAFTDLMAQKDPTEVEVTATIAFVWAQGYMSTANLYLKGASKPQKNLTAWTVARQKDELRTICARQGPSGVVLEAVRVLFEELPNMQIGE
jgi:hypothetical protein